MSPLDPVFLFPLLLVVLVLAGFTAVGIGRVVRARRRASRRVKEQPNSFYTSAGVKHNEAKHRWHNMALDRIHEINREEVVRLIAKVEATSVEALRPNERAFLDRMAELAGTTPPPAPPEPRDTAKPTPRDLRHRPA
jgi:hypothetical protein